MANTYKIKIWTGPTAVEEYADMFEKAGLEVTVRGTEHIHIVSSGCEASAAFHNACVDVERMTGKPIGLRHFQAI